VLILLPDRLLQLNAEDPDHARVELLRRADQTATRTDQRRLRCRILPISVSLSATRPAAVDRLDGILPGRGEDKPNDAHDGDSDHDGLVDAGHSTPLASQGRLDGTATWTGTVVRPAGDSLGYSVRVRPAHPLLVHPNETNLVLWAE
jgi:hypothetical protein